MTRFAGKYGLYLYREKGVDLSEQPTGIPVLFIPGHAGSYKQIRSIAAESAYYYHQHYATSQDTWDQGMRHLDFFTVDFNEEFSALHGQSLLEQAEYLNDAIDYILKLYPLSRKWGPQQNKQLPDPTSVIVIGHSMGGTVARTMFTIHNYQPGTINTIITLSTPHILPPAPFDWKISKIYDDIHHFWKSAYDDDDDDDSSGNLIQQHDPTTITTTFRNTTDLLKDVSMVSIAGGNLDSTVCSDSANVGTFLPSNHGFTVFSTAIPRVWTGTDHVSILSCNQLVKVLSKTLLNIVDARKGSQTKPLEKRIKVLEKAFLSGLENRQGNGVDLDLGELTFHDLKFNESQFLLPGQRLVLDNNNSNFGGHRKTMTFLPSYEGADGFAVLTSFSVGKGEPFDLLLCNKLEKRVKGTTRMGCRAATTNDGIVVPIPASTSQDTNPASGNTFMFASITFEEMHGYEFLAILDRRGHGDTFSRGFLMAEPYDFDTNTRIVEKSMLDIAFNGIQLQTSPALFSSIRIPSIESSMLAYHIIVDRGGRCSIPSHFTPLLRQSISSMHESKFYVNIANDRKQIDMSVHGRTAFSTASPPIRLSQSRYRDLPLDDSYKTNSDGLEINIWTDPSTCNQPIKIELTVDWYGSIGRIGFRNGIMLPAFTFIVVMAVWAMQIQCYFATGVYPHFGQAMVFCLKLVFPLISVLLSMAGIYQGWTDADAYQLLDDHVLLGKWWKYYAPDSFSSSKPSMAIVWNDVLTGRTDLFFWWIPLCGLFMSVGFVCVLWLFLSVFLHTCATLVSLCRHYYPFTVQSNPKTKQQQQQTHNDGSSSSSSSNRLPDHGLFWFIPDGFGSDLDRQRMERRVITTLILFSLVATCIPYQFVFLVAFLVHIITCVRSLVKLWITPPSKELERKNRYHYLQSILLLFVTLLPFNAPILVVWIRNLSVHWFVPFSSDHSVFAIAPFMIYVEMLTNHTLMLPRISSR
ncbi:PGAP1-like protein-domain-containing protein [Absidia repens]|uniref:GPI inositol-deacylase n=1 Tax=Absidia repens TaxID=90262 RepID=A0A1X2ID57_9FUNG|nr:PGAP1-like protein-domain-containing protein [Absidia repens]